MYGSGIVQRTRTGKTCTETETGEETKELLHAWTPRFERLEGASDKVRAAIWNEICEEFKGS